MKTKSKPVPLFLNDAEAEQFVAKADLSTYDLSGFKPMDFVLEPKAVALNTRPPQNLLDSDVAQ